MWNTQSKLTCPHRGEFKVYCTFQSHEPEFDYLKSLEIEEKINTLQWLRQSNPAHFLLTTNGSIAEFAFFHNDLGLYEKCFLKAFLEILFRPLYCQLLQMKLKYNNIPFNSTLCRTSQYKKNTPYFYGYIVRLTPPSQPNKVGLKCPSVRPSIRPQKVSLILMTFGM